MATTYDLTEFELGQAVNTQGTPGTVQRTVSIDLVTLTGDATYAFVINDLIRLFYVPAFTKITRGVIRTNVDLDDHATPTLELDLQITDGTTTKTLLDNGTGVFDTGSAAVVDTDAIGDPSTVDGLFYVIPYDGFYAQLKAIAAAAGDAGASAVIYVTLEYSRVLEGTDGIRDWPDATP